MKAERLLCSFRDLEEDIDRMLRLQRWHTRELESEELSPARRELLTREQKRLRASIAKGYRQHAFRLKAITRLLDRLPEKAEREALRLHYLSRMRVEDAAELLGYSERHLYRLRSRALERLDALLKGKG